MSKYSNEQKLEVVKGVMERGMSQQTAGNMIGSCKGDVQKWIKLYQSKIKRTEPRRVKDSILIYRLVFSVQLFGVSTSGWFFNTLIVFLKARRKRSGNFKRGRITLKNV